MSAPVASSREPCKPSSPRPGRNKCTACTVPNGFTLWTAQRKTFPGPLQPVRVPILLIDIVSAHRPISMKQNCSALAFVVNSFEQITPQGLLVCAMKSDKECES